MKRAVVFAHYDNDDIVDSYVFNYIEKLKKATDYIVIVSTAKLSLSDINKLKKICSSVIVRENIGYDFMSYKVGLESFDYAQYDEVLICNDSVYGPFYQLENILEKMSNKQCDFWGMTEGKEISYHLQSYFIVCKKNILNSEAFRLFWNDVEVLNDKRMIIEKYEIGFSENLFKSGFTASVYVDYEPSFMDKMKIKLKRITLYKMLSKIYGFMKGTYKLQNPLAVNITHQYWKELLLYSKMPFIKVELLRDNPVNVEIQNYKDVIAQISNYDVSLIENHLTRVKK